MHRCGEGLRQRHKGAGHTGTEDAGAKGRRGCCLFVHNCPGNDLTEVIAVAAFVLKSHLAEEIAGYRENREKRVGYGERGPGKRWENRLETDGMGEEVCIFLMTGCLDVERLNRSGPPRHGGQAAIE